MNYPKENEEEDGGEAAVFIEGSCSSDSEGVTEISDRRHRSSCKRLIGESSPPLILAFTSGPAQVESSSPSPASIPGLQEEEEEEDSDHPVEEWMILGEEEQEGDSTIQLNLAYWSSSEDDSGDEDSAAALSAQTCWADQSVSSRYFGTGRSLICQMCNRTGHLAKSCYYHKRSPTCVLCGVKGHVQRDCPSRPCPSCGLPAHGLKLCEKPPLWNQHCQRCGMTGHLSDIRLEVPLRPQTVHRLKHKRCLAHCYNCSKRGHYGYECTKRRMVSRTFPSLPYVCHYDTIDDILQCHTRVEQQAKELVNAGSMGALDQQHLSEPTGESGEENLPIQGRSRTKQETYRRTGKRKTWPERRRERQEIKRLRREAQAKREGGLMGRYRRNSGDEACYVDPFESPLHGHGQYAPPPQKKKKRRRRGQVAGGAGRAGRQRGGRREEGLNVVICILMETWTWKVKTFSPQSKEYATEEEI
ncbi:hypothetical protein INR49_024482 [Caranx melampygus]|nr:hypothetical protein INR49_024482 [Caranx melampygus]